jgi:hypothetical protein
MDADPGLELAVGTAQKQLYVLDADGSEKVTWPRVYEGALTGTPTLGDPDKDGRAELVFGDVSKRVRAVDLGPGTFDGSRMPWPTMHRDFLRRGSVSNLLVGVPPAPTGARGLAFAPSPNPSRGAVRLALTRDGDLAFADPDAPVGIRIVAINGTLARTLTLPAPRGANATLVWDGRDERGRALAPGLYFIEARWGQAVAKSRIVRL